MFLLFIFIMPTSFKLPALVVEQKLGTINQLSALTGMLSLVNIPIGASFGFFFKKLHDKVFPIGFCIFTIGFFIMAFAINFAMLAIGNIIMGLGGSLAIPYMYNWLDWVAPKNSVNLATTIILVMVNIGCTVSPMVINAFAKTARQGLIGCGIFFAIFSIYAIVHYVRFHNVNKNSNVKAAN